jgi:hypothetical protein
LLQIERKYQSTSRLRGRDGEENRFVSAGTGVEQIYRRNGIAFETEALDLDPAFKAIYLIAPTEGIHSWNSWLKFVSMNDKTLKVLGTMAAQLRQLQIPLQGDVDVFVESSPGSIWVASDSTGTSTSWSLRKNPLPGWTKTPQRFGIRGKGSQVYPLAQWLNGSDWERRILFLTAIHDRFHTLDGHFMIAHDLAHGTEINEAPNSRAWREARADLLAYFITGENELKYPRELGELYKAHWPKLSEMSEPIEDPVMFVARSLVEPSVDHLQRLIPELAAYHLNSQVFSSALYQVAQALGPESVSLFIRWMDQQGQVLAPEVQMPRNHRITDGAGNLRPDSNMSINGASEYEQLKQRLEGLVGAELSNLFSIYWRWSQLHFAHAPGSLETIHKIFSEKGWSP